MTTFNHCRFCGNWRDQGLVKYGPRHYAHFRCYLDKGKKLDALPAWMVSTFPYFLLKDRGLLDQADAIAGANGDVQVGTRQDRGLADV